MSKTCETFTIAKPLVGLFSVVRQEVLRTWPELSGQTVAGFGFAIPLLRPFLNKSRRVIALMPGPQGAMAWPTSQDNVSVLCEEARWPIETGHIDRLIVLHGLETSDDQNAVLSEAFRVLGPGGKRFHRAEPRWSMSRSDLTNGIRATLHNWTT